MAGQRVGGSGLTKAKRLLTQRGLESLKPEAAPYRVPDTRATGLAARVATDGVVTWDLAFRIAKTGKVRRVSLGRWPDDRSLEEARDRAAAITKAARDGRDLLAEEAAAGASAREAERAAAARLTVGGLIQKYLASPATRELRTRDDIGRRLQRALAPLIDEPADTIRRRNIREQLDAADQQGFSREAEKRRQTVGAMFGWAVKADILDENPTIGLPTYDSGTPRDRVLSTDEISAVWLWLRDSGMSPDVQDVLRLQLLLGARVSEIGGMRRGEINAQERLWVLPAERSKNRKPRVTPLVGQAWDIVAGKLDCTDITLSTALFLSDAGGPLRATNVGHALLARKLPVAPRFSTHDLRRTVASHMVDMGISLDVVASVLGHAAGGATVGTLRRHYVRAEQIETKRNALDAWDARLAAIIAGTGVLHGGNVVPLPRAAG